MSASPIAVTSPLTASNGSSSGPTEFQHQQPQQLQPQPQPQSQPQPQPQPQHPPQGESTEIAAVPAVGMGESRSVAIGPQDLDVGRGVEDDDDEDDVPGLEDRKTKRGFSKRVTLRDLERYFEFPIEEVSKMMGVSTTIIKRLCRKYGIKRWPYRQIRSVNKSIKYVELLARTAMGPDRQRLQDQLVSLHYKKQLICQAATTGASAKVRKSILQMRPEDLDADTLLRSGGGHDGDGAEGGAGADVTGSNHSIGHDDGEDGQERADIIGSMALEQQAMDAAAAAAVAAAVQNPYAMPTHMPMAGMAMGYSPYVHMAAAAQAQQQAVAQHHHQVQQKTGEGAAVAAAAPGISGVGPSQMHAYSHLGLYGGYPGMLGMAYPFQAHAYPGMPGYGIQGMGGYPSLASGSSEHLAASLGMSGVAAMQLAQTMQQQPQQHIDLNQPQEIQQQQLLQQQLHQRQLQTQEQAVMTDAAAAEVASIDATSIAAAPGGEAANGEGGGGAPEAGEGSGSTEPPSGDSAGEKASTKGSNERRDDGADFGAGQSEGGDGAHMGSEKGGSASAAEESNGKGSGDDGAST